MCFTSRVSSRKYGCREIIAHGRALQQEMTWKKRKKRCPSNMVEEEISFLVEESRNHPYLNHTSFRKKRGEVEQIPSSLRGEDGCLLRRPLHITNKQTKVEHLLIYPRVPTRTVQRIPKTWLAEQLICTSAAQGLCHAGG